ncbi:MAG: hypothetical protein AAGI10_01430 [Pseudomonadota bacterium]
MRWVLFGLAALVVAGCEPVPSGTGSSTSFASVPAEVVAAADPKQNVASARLLDDGCYWYEYNGPVEQTLLPLRTPGGNPICALSREEREAVAAAG